MEKEIDCYFDIHELYKEAEGQAWEGWYCPLWASINEEENEIELKLGGAVSNNTSFFEGDVHNVPKSWVGSIDCWRRTWGEDDAEAWAEECNGDVEDFDSDEFMWNEICNMDLDDEEKGIKKNIIEFAKSKGYDKVCFC